jgi:hypothetical protein
MPTLGCHTRTIRLFSAGRLVTNLAVRLFVPSSRRCSPPTRANALPPRAGYINAEPYPPYQWSRQMIQFIAKVDKNHLIIDGPSLLTISFFRLVLTSTSSLPGTNGAHHSSFCLCRTLLIPSFSSPLSPTQVSGITPPTQSRTVSRTAASTWSRITATPATPVS